MTVELKPETERLVREELWNGHVQTVDELIVYGVKAFDFLMESPFAGSEIDLERQRDYGCPVDL